MCSVQFVVMFVASDVPKKTKYSCYAYVSQSTRNMRSLLKEHVSLIFFLIAHIHVYPHYMGSCFLLLGGFSISLCEHSLYHSSLLVTEQYSFSWILMLLQDVSFSMPLCRSKVEEVTAEDLVELSQIEKYNLGQVWNSSIFFLVISLKMTVLRSRIS